MRIKRLKGIVTSLAVFLFVSVSYAQGEANDVYWRIDPNVKTCSMVIDPSLTQAQWHTFTEEIGAILSFKSLASAQPLGKGRFRIAIDDAFSPVDQRDPAWINTFTHPDENCPLGDVIKVPTIRAGMGVSDKMDVGAYWTTTPSSNYGAVGGEFKYAFLQESEKFPAAAVRASVSILTGVPDFDMNVYSVDLVAGKTVAMLTPYVGFKESLAIGTETTSKVDLHRESLPIAQGYAGVACSIWMLNLTAEYNVSTVNSFALAVGYNF